MKKVVFMTLGLMVVAILATVNPVSARGPMAGGGPGGTMMGLGGPGGGCCGTDGVAALEKLNLTPEQTAKIANLREEMFKEVAPIKEKMFSKRNELKQLWLQSTPDEAKISLAQKEARELMGQMQEKRTAFRLQVGKILTTEQRDKLRAGFTGPGPGSRWGGRCKMDGPAGPGDKAGKGKRSLKN